MTRVAKPGRPPTPAERRAFVIAQLSADHYDLYRLIALYGPATTDAVAERAYLDGITITRAALVRRLGVLRETGLLTQEHDTWAPTAPQASALT